VAFLDTARRPPGHYSSLLATTLALQRPSGHFGPAEGSPPADLAAAWLLSLAEREHRQRAEEARRARLYLGQAIARRQNEDGSFSAPGRSRQPDPAASWFWGQALAWLATDGPAGPTGGERKR
jgi:hypothetical protein